MKNKGEFESFRAFESSFSSLIKESRKLKLLSNLISSSDRQLERIDRFFEDFSYESALLKSFLLDEQRARDSIKIKYQSVFDVEEDLLFFENFLSLKENSFQSFVIRKFLNDGSLVVDFQEIKDLEKLFFVFLDFNSLKEKLLYEKLEIFLRNRDFRQKIQILKPLNLIDDKDKISSLFHLHERIFFTLFKRTKLIRSLLSKPTDLKYEDYDSLDLTDLIDQSEIDFILSKSLNSLSISRFYGFVFEFLSSEEEEEDRFSHLEKCLKVFSKLSALEAKASKFRVFPEVKAIYFHVSFLTELSLIQPLLKFKPSKLRLFFDSKSLFSKTLRFRLDYFKDLSSRTKIEILQKETENPLETEEIVFAFFFSLIDLKSNELEELLSKIEKSFSSSVEKSLRIELSERKNNFFLLLDLKDFLSFLKKEKTLNSISKFETLLLKLIDETFKEEEENSSSFEVKNFLSSIEVLIDKFSSQFSIEFFSHLISKTILLTSLDDFFSTFHELRRFFSRSKRIFLNRKEKKEVFSSILAESISTRILGSKNDLQRHRALNSLIKTLLILKEKSLRYRFFEEFFSRLLNEKDKNLNLDEFFREFCLALDRFELNSSFSKKELRIFLIEVSFFLANETEKAFSILEKTLFESILLGSDSFLREIDLESLVKKNSKTKEKLFLNFKKSLKDKRKSKFFI